MIQEAGDEAEIGISLVKKYTGYLAILALWLGAFFEVQQPGNKKSPSFHATGCHGVVGQSPRRATLHIRTGLNDDDRVTLAASCCRCVHPSFLSRTCTQRRGSLRQRWGFYANLVCLLLYCSLSFITVFSLILTCPEGCKPGKRMPSNLFFFCFLSFFSFCSFLHVCPLCISAFLSTFSTFPLGS